jgi:peptidoglycan/xylan/chitin deacetylase (PgdA/CDA1 family)
MLRARIGKFFGMPSISRTLLTVRRQLPSPWLIVLTYHRTTVLPSSQEFDEGVVDCTPESLDQNLRFLKRFCTVIDLDRVLAFCNGAPLPQNPVLITFDDGYRDNHDIVMQLLLRHVVPATFFVSTSYIDERKLFWWDRMNILVRRAKHGEIVLSYPYPMRLSLDPTERSRTLRRLLRLVKDHYALDLDRFLGGLAEATDTNISPAEERQLSNDTLMTWDHVAALRSAGMAVQSHTVSHRVLQTLTPSMLDHELRESKRVLHERLGIPIHSISYPVGKPLSFTPHIRRAVRETGYELGFSNRGGANHVFDFDRADAKRISMSLEISEQLFHGIMALPYTSY